MGRAGGISALIASFVFNYGSVSSRLQDVLLTLSSLTLTKFSLSLRGNEGLKVAQYRADRGHTNGDKWPIYTT